MTPLQERAAIINWVTDQPHHFNVAVALSPPKSLRAAEKGWDDLWLQRKLTHFFNLLDRRVFGAAANRRRGLRVPRFVVLERTDESGWHAHIALSTPPHFDATQLIALAKRLWISCLKEHARGPFQEHLFWAETVTGAYIRYSTKDIASGIEGAAMLDVHNTSF